MPGKIKIPDQNVEERDQRVEQKKTCYELNTPRLSQEHIVDNSIKVNRLQTEDLVNDHKENTVKPYFE